MNGYAPEYSKKEKIALMFKYIIWVVPVLISTKCFFLPWLKVYAENAHCYKYGNITGTEVIFYGLFVGTPFLFALTLVLFEGSDCLKIISLGQYPLPGEKVFKQTKYTYGLGAKLRGYSFFLVITLLVGIAIKGLYFADQAVELVNLKNLSICKVGLAGF